MAAIKLNPKGKNLTAEIVSHSPHVIGIELTVFDKGGNEVEKYEGGITEKSRKVDFPLKNPPGTYDGCEIQATCTFKSPNGGDDVPFSAVYQLLEDDQPAQPTTSMDGNTNNGEFIDTEIFDVTV